jgi:hypothetical protein
MTLGAIAASLTMTVTICRENKACTATKYHLFLVVVVLLLFTFKRDFRPYQYQADLSLAVSSLQPTDDAPLELNISSTRGSKKWGKEFRLHGICEPLAPGAMNQSVKFPPPGKHPKFLFGVPSTLSSSVEKERRQLIRETYLDFDRQIYDMTIGGRLDGRQTTISLSRLPSIRNRVCSLQEWTCNYDQVHEECQIIFAFFVGDNPNGSPYILDDSLTDFRSMLSKTDNANVTEESGLIRLNIRENQFGGKMTTWFQFAALVGQEFPEIDYTVKADSDTLVFTPNFLEDLELRHWKILNSRKEPKTERIYGGVKFLNTSCGKNEKHHACPLPLVGDSYMSGELNFMSMDLARYIASDACPRDNITIPHEDVSLSNYVYSYTSNPKVTAITSDTNIDRIFVHQERVLRTFNQTFADMMSRRAGQGVDLRKQFRKFIWGHCKARPTDLFPYFKDPKKVRIIWNDFVMYYYKGLYQIMDGAPTIHQWVEHDNAESRTKSKTVGGHKIPKIVRGTSTTSCAILFFGLPRSYKRYVLPSIIRNIIVPNLQYNCDYYVHYYQIDWEEAGRSGHAGEINPDAILLLEAAMQQIHNETMSNETRGISSFGIVPQVLFISDTNTTFWKARGNLVEKYRTTKRKDGNYLYYPYREPNYFYPTTMDNIVKQWHSIDAVWKKMEQRAIERNKVYGRVAMLRNDVIYINPIDVFRINSSAIDINNEFVTIPGWAGWPINDRMVSGPFNAVKVWATERFSRLDKYVRANKIARAGYGMHPERFLNGEIIPHITKNLGYKLDLAKRFCFVRVRADGAIWIDDCNRGFPGNDASAIFQRDLLPGDAVCVRENFSKWASPLYCNFTEHEDVDLLWNLRVKPITQNE